MRRGRGDGTGSDSVVSEVVGGNEGVVGLTRKISCESRGVRGAISGVPNRFCPFWVYGNTPEDSVRDGGTGGKRSRRQNR